MLADADLVSIQETRTKIDRAYEAFQILRNRTQEQIDSIVEAMAEAGRKHAMRLAEMAVEETTYGNARDKLAKNLLAADILPLAIRGMRTIGVLREIPETNIIEIGVPVGVVAAILPTTNPTSTAIYKSIISVKAGNAVVLSPHPRARRCSCESAAVLYEAARAAGAPENIIQCVSSATIESTNALMRHPKTSVILATGGSGIVKAAYSSGKPAYGVGPGNVPVLLEDSFDVDECVRNVVAGKSFDYGTVCSSEQTLVARSTRREAVLEALQKHGAYLCTPEQGQALAKILITQQWTISADCVGQAPQKIAKMAGFSVPDGTSILAVEIGGVGKQHPLSMEKLSPVLSLLFVKDWEEQVRASQAILKFGGLGHTCAIYSKSDPRIREYGLRMPAFRVLVNTPTPQGATGITTGVQPAMTLGCGAMAGNATSDNIGPQHLMNIKRVAKVVRKVEDAFSVPLTGGAGMIASRETAKSSAAAGLSQAIGAPVSVVAAVDRYLAQKGIAPTSSGEIAAQVVDRFLTARGVAAPTTAAASCSVCSAPASPLPSSSAGGTPVTAEKVPAAPAAPASVPDAPAPETVDFVSEADVRLALTRSRKIYIRPKTIVTPAARDLAAPHDLLIEVASPQTKAGTKRGSEE
jgi:acyl-CoA reductase-like NAD-dependent aldehyde dehydrogenase